MFFFYFAPSVIPLAYTPSVVPLLWYPLHIPPYRAAPLYMGLYEHIIIYNLIIVLPLESIFEFVLLQFTKKYGTLLDPAFCVFFYENWKNN